MRLKCAWDTAKGKADKTQGTPDLELKKHLVDTSQTHLPQAEILQGCFDLLVEKGLLEEAYLRGSFGRGHADVHSDIDLFTVVAPENLEKVYDTVREYLAEKGQIVTDCHDRLVENYGGIGFMFIAQNDKEDGHSYQFDLYMAIKGVSPRTPTSIKPRIFFTDPDYKWTEQYGKESITLPKEAQDFIHRHTAGDSTAERMELLMQELLITIYVTNKHIERGQVSRTVVDNASMVASAIEFLQLLTEYKPTGYSPLYLGNEIVNFVRENGDDEMVQAADKLEKLFTQPISRKKLHDTLTYAASVLQQAFPEKYENQVQSIAYFDKLLGEDKKAVAKPAAKKAAGNKRHGL